MILNEKNMIYNYLLNTNSKKGDQRIIFEKYDHYSFSRDCQKGTYIEMYCKRFNGTLKAAKRLLQIIMQDFELQKMYYDIGYVMILENDNVLHIRGYGSNYDTVRIEVKLY